VDCGATCGTGSSQVSINPNPVSHVFVLDSDVTLAPSDDPATIAPGLQAQLQEDIALEWGSSTSSTVRADGGINPPQPQEVEMQIHLDAPEDEQGALALHDHKPDGTPIIHAYYSLLQKYGASLSSALSHEIGEETADPEGDAEATLPDGRVVAVEICDQVEEITYQKNGVEVSDFNTRSNFGLNGNDAPYDFLGKQPTQFTNMPGGYQQVLTPTGWQQITSDEHVTATTGLAAYHAHLHRLGLSRRARRARRRAAKLAAQASDRSE
jgi:hypothetical protein